MFLLGLILIIVGIAVAALLAHPQAHVLGGLIVLIGVIVLVVALVDVRGVHDAGAVVWPAPVLVRLQAWRARRLLS